MEISNLSILAAGSTLIQAQYYKLKCKRIFISILKVLKQLGKSFLAGAKVVRHFSQWSSCQDARCWPSHSPCPHSIISLPTENDILSPQQEAAQYICYPRQTEFWGQCWLINNIMEISQHFCLLGTFKAFKGTLSQKDAGWTDPTETPSNMSSERKSSERSWRAMVVISVYNHAWVRLKSLRYSLQNLSFPHLTTLTWDNVCLQFWGRKRVAIFFW